MNKARYFWLFIAFMVITALTLPGCDLFNNPADPDFLNNLHRELAWTNAEKLEVTIAFLTEWGTSNPPQGTITSVDIRKGYNFNLEFIPSSGYSFVNWLAFDSKEYNLSMLADYEEALKKCLIKKGLVVVEEENISGSGVITSTIKINTSTPVTLVPWCSDRVNVRYTNPPIIGTGALYFRSQEITIWFSMPLIHEGVDFFGENMITLAAEDTRTGIPWDGDIYECFTDQVYDDKTNSISIRPDVENYPPANHTIIVTVGTGILAENEKGMAAPVEFRYRVGEEIVSKSYKASNVWANHNPENDRRVESFFYQTAPTERDRRLRKNENDEYEVTLYFTASRSMGEIEDFEPDSLQIALIHYADLMGNPVVHPPLTQAEINSGIILEDGFKILFTDNDIIANDEENNSAGGIYRYMNTSTNPLGAYYYKTVFTFERTDYPAGIYRLALMPYRNTGDLGDPVPPDLWQTAIAENSYVTVVIDNKAPDGRAVFSFSGHAMEEGTGDEIIYIYSADYDDEHETIPGDKFLTMIPDFTSIHDNNDKSGKIDGILIHRANPFIPWTMDEQRNILWQWNISGMNESDWLNMGSIPAPFDLSGFSLSDTDIHYINIRFKDTANNISDWESVGRIKFDSQPAAAPPYNGIATYNYSNDTITVRWTNPSMMSGVRIEYSINNISQDPVFKPGKGQQSHVFRGIQKYNGLIHTRQDYVIRLIAYKDRDDPANDKELDHLIAISNEPNVFLVTDHFDNSGIEVKEGTLRHALTKVIESGGGVIRFLNVVPGISIIELTSSLPEITKSLTIEGNGITLKLHETFSGFERLLSINAEAAEVLEVKISRVHFNGGRIMNNGAGIRNEGGNLTIESCIFSDNKANQNGGAIYNLGGTLNIKGCTFYNNEADSGGAIFNTGNSEVSLLGNIFYGNKGRLSPIIGGGSVSSLGYNVVDTNQSGFNLKTEDVFDNTSPITPTFFRLLFDGGAFRIIPRILNDYHYPQFDFYGEWIDEFSASAGAVQSTAATGPTGGFVVNLLPPIGNYTAQIISLPDAHGLFTGDVTVVADDVEHFGYWLVDGKIAGYDPWLTIPEPSNGSSSIDVQAVFAIMVDNYDDGYGYEHTPGTLRYALHNVQPRGMIRFRYVDPGNTVIELTQALPTISRNLIIEGNGITLTRAADYNGNLLIINISGQGQGAHSQYVRISRVHFKNGNSSNPGAAIRSSGVESYTLTLESCIFSGNESPSGGAIHQQNGTLNIKGCTFYNNKASSNGGAIFINNCELNLTGNLFYGNTAQNNPIIFHQGIDSSATSLGYNVVDVAIGTGNNQSGFAGKTGDIFINSSLNQSLSSPPFILIFNNGFAGKIPVRPNEYPLFDFNGNPILENNISVGAVQYNDPGCGGCGECKICCGDCGVCEICDPGCGDCGACEICNPNCGDCGVCEDCVSDCEHTPGEPQTTPATCAADGSTITRCTKCDEITSTVVLDKLGHITSDWTPLTPATCEEDSTEKSTCTREDCEETAIRSIEGTALGHNLNTETEIINQPTYITEGMGKKECQRPGCNHTEPQPVPRIAIESEADFLTVIEGLNDNTLETAYTLWVKLNSTFRRAQTNGSLGHTLIANPNINVILDFSESTFEEIPMDAFACLNLIGVTIPSTVQTIESYAFSDCTNLKSVTFKGNSLTEIGEQAFRGTAITGLIIPDSVITIGNSAFLHNGNLTSVTISNSVQTIESLAFAGCINLTSITIPNSVKTIGAQAFSDCDRLAVINIGTGVETIEEGAFTRCINLNSITIPANVITLGDYVFWESRNLTSITFAAGSNITSFGDGVSPEGFNGNGGNTLRDAYEAAAPKAGTYTRAPNGTTWAKD